MRKTLVRTLLLPAVLAMSGALTLTACGSGGASNSGTSAPVKQGPGKAQKTAAPGELPPADMVAAVSAAKSGPPVELKFDLPSKPQVGEPVEVDIALLPIGQAVERIQAKFQVNDGLQLVSGGELSPVEKPADGVAIRHKVTILPTRDGIFTLDAAVTIDGSKESLVRVFSIPVIAGVGFPESAPRADVADGTAATSETTAAKAH